MKHLRFPIVIVCLLGVLLQPLAAASSAPEKKTDRSPGAAMANTLSTVTGVAISPLLGTGAYGAYQYFTATTPEKKAALPWFAKIGFWLPVLVIVGACAAKDSLGAILPPGMKKPLDVLETVENKASGLVAAGAVIPLSVDALSKLIVAHSQAPGLASSGFASIQVGVLHLSWVLDILTVPFGIAVFLVVWMASHAINVLILLSPWGAVDAALKGARTGLLGLLTLTATINPWVGAALSLVVILVAYLVAGWAFRLTVFGSIFCWDFLTVRKHRYAVSPGNDRLFTGAKLTELKVPIRTYGTLGRSSNEGHWVFAFRPWLVGARKEVEVASQGTEIGAGAFVSTLRDSSGTFFILPPRFRDHEQELVSAYGVPGGVQPAGLRKAWSALIELFTGRARPQAA
ncbi:MAG: hypothetical protein WC378_06315 [Opitutaceae bacterium]